MGSLEGCKQAVNDWIDYKGEERDGLLGGLFSPEELKLFE